MFIDEIKSCLASFSPHNYSREYTINLLKEYLQFHVLNVIYNSSYKDLIFTGGTCAHICFGLDRLSEDIDFDATSPINVENIAIFIAEQFKKTGFEEIEFSIKRRQESIYLKFPLLKRLRLATAGQSDKLYVKIDLNKSTAKTFTTDLFVANKYNLSFLIKHYDLPSLFAGKLHAIFARSFLKGTGDKINIKGRDFYDLLWFLNRGVKPNLARLNEMLELGDNVPINSLTELKIKLNERIKSINPQFIYEDVRFFFKDSAYITNVTRNYQQLIKNLLEKNFD